MPNAAPAAPARESDAPDAVARDAVARDRDRFRHDLMLAAIRMIEADAAAQPSLDELARRMGLSPARFQKLFSRWVGISPKRYLQWLTLDHARTLLRQRRTVLDAALESGLSGPGRLHDLFVRWEAMSPGDYARAGAGLTIRWTFCDSPFGEALAMATERGLCGLAFCAACGREAAFADLSARWPAAALVEDAGAVAPLAAAAFARKEARLHLIGAPFQIKVWEALLAIPPGHVAAYGDIARAVGRPGAARAVGTAVGRNPVSWLIPCHRAIRASGELGGYRWGLPVKRAMLAWETARLEGAA